MMVRWEIVWLMLCGLIAGCATQAEKAADAANENMSAGLQSLKTCIDAERQSVEYMVISSRTPLPGIGQPNLAQLAEQAFVTDDEKQAIYSYQPKVHTCGQAFVNYLSGINVAFVPLINAYMSAYDTALVKLVNREIAWGKFNQSLYAINNAYDSVHAKIVQDLSNNLAIADQQERQRISDALSMAAQQFSYQQQSQAAIRNQQLPTQTTCSSTGNYLNCTTWGH